MDPPSAGAVEKITPFGDYPQGGWNTEFVKTREKALRYAEISEFRIRCPQSFPQAVEKFSGKLWKTFVKNRGKTPCGPRVPLCARGTAEAADLFNPTPSPAPTDHQFP